MRFDRTRYNREVVFSNHVSLFLVAGGSTFKQQGVKLGIICGLVEDEFQKLPKDMVKFKCNLTCACAVSMFGCDHKCYEKK